MASDLSMDQVDVLLHLARPGTTSSSMRALGGKEKRLANTLCKRGLATIYGGAGGGKLYFVRTQAGELLARTTRRLREERQQRLWEEFEGSTDQVD